MKTLNSVVEKSEDSFYAYVKEIDSCVAGGSTYNEVKGNLEEMINLCLEEDPTLKKNTKMAINLSLK